MSDCLLGGSCNTYSFCLKTGRFATRQREDFIFCEVHSDLRRFTPLSWGVANADEARDDAEAAKAIISAVCILNVRPLRERASAKVIERLQCVIRRSRSRVELLIPTAAVL